MEQFNLETLKAKRVVLTKPHARDKKYCIIVEYSYGTDVFPCENYATALIKGNALAKQFGLTLLEA